MYSFIYIDKYIYIYVCTVRVNIYIYIYTCIYLWYTYNIHAIRCCSPIYDVGPVTSVYIYIYIHAHIMSDTVRHYDVSHSSMTSFNFSCRVPFRSDTFAAHPIANIHMDMGCFHKRYPKSRMVVMENLGWEQGIGWSKILNRWTATTARVMFSQLYQGFYQDHVRTSLPSRMCHDPRQNINIRMGTS